MIWRGIFILCIACLAGNVNGRLSIVRGKVANIADFPHQVSFKHGDEHFCGGSIVSHKHVVTAGHCVKHLIPSGYKKITIVAGTSYFNGKKGYRHTIANITIHPFYRATSHRAWNDIAVVKLNDHMDYNIHQFKIDLPKRDYTPGDRGFVIGWGLIRENPPTFPTLLQKLEVKLLSREECQKRVINPKETKIYDREICVIHTPRTGTCVGDSGGPLIIHKELVGIVSWSDEEKCETNHPDVYTNVFKYKRFIEQIINQV